MSDSISPAHVSPAHEALSTPPWITHASGIAWGTVALFIAIVIGYGALFLAAVSGTVALPWLTPAATLLLYLAFTVVHEAGHGNVSHEVQAMKPLERGIGWLASVPFLVIPFGMFAKIHDFHHAFTNDPQRDPDFWVSSESRPRAFWHAMLLAFKYIALSTTRFAKHPVIARTHAGSGIYYACTATLMATLVVSGHVDLLLWLGVFPVLLASVVLGMLFDWIPHTPAVQQGRYQNTRTYLFPGLNVLTLGQSYHHIHHLYPRVSWYHYKKVFKAIRPRLEAQNAPIETLFSRKNQPFLGSPHAQAPVAGESQHQLTLTVESVHQETPDAVCITFAPLSAPLLFKAGQYLTVRTNVDDSVDDNAMVGGNAIGGANAMVGGNAAAGHEALTRCYSICESPASGRLAIGVKRVAGGRLSGHLNTRLRAGDKLSVAGPFGNFIYAPEEFRGITLIAGGSGITPILSILQAALENAKEPFVHLIYANRSIVDAMFMRRLNALALKYPDALKITYVYEHRHAGWNGPTGYLSHALLTALLDETPDSLHGRFYLCGPAPMKAQVLKTLQGLPIDADRIFVETFETVTPEPQGAVHRVEVALVNGVQHVLDVAENQTVLQAANRAGIKLPHACGVGQCGCCMMRVLEGTSTLASDDTPGLLPGERALGLTLACQCKPNSPLRLQEGGMH